MNQVNIKSHFYYNPSLKIMWPWAFFFSWKSYRNSNGAFIFLRSTWPFTSLLLDSTPFLWPLPLDLTPQTNSVLLLALLHLHSQQHVLKGRLGAFKGREYIIEGTPLEEWKGWNSFLPLFLDRLNHEGSRRNSFLLSFEWALSMLMLPKEELL